MEQAYRLVTSALISGCQDKLAVLHAAESFETNYHLCCDIADKAVAIAINLDADATQEERDNLRSKVQGIQRRWGEMLHHVESGLSLFGVVSPATLMVQ